MATRTSAIVASEYAMPKGFWTSFYKNVIKTGVDFLLALPVVIASIPFYLLVKIAYMLSGDFDGIFYKQVRVGENGKQFTMYKIRTMVVDKDGAILKKLLEDEDNLREWNELQKLTNDPRITKIGRLLRKSSLDELPQFLNILKGQLALVGPRPLVPGELESHHGVPEIYQSVKPGLTGWWAVSGRSDLLYRKRLQLEYYYVQNFSMKLDLKIILKTIKVVVKKEGAK